LTPEAGVGAPAWVGRLVVYGLVALLGIAAVVDAEWWPVSSMRLFSQVRSDSAVSWEVRLVGPNGTEEILDVASLGRGFRGAHHLVPELAAMSAADRDAVCRAWAEAAAAAGHVAAVEVRIDRVVRSVPTSDDDVAAERSRTEAVRCAGT
jgi:hypothetical protein